MTALLTFPTSNSTYRPITPNWKQLRYHPKQARLWRSISRTVHVTAGRGSGKTEIARRRVCAHLIVRKPWTDPLYFYALPTYGQAKRVAWDPINALIPDSWIKRRHNSGMIIETVFGSTLFVVGLDNPARIEGVQWDGGVIDESSDQKPGVYGRSVRPALSHRSGWCWRIGVPKRHGPGAKEYKEAFYRGVRQEAGFESYTWPSTDILTPAEVAELAATLDPKDFNEQVLGNWETAGGQAFYAFDPDYVMAKVPYRPNALIVVGCDFNVSPMCWCMSHLVTGPYGPELHTFDELFMKDCSTQRALNALHSRYSAHQSGWLFVGDASSAARKTSATSTDYTQILNDKRFNAKVRFPKANPPIKDRLASCNALLCNALDQRRCKIDYGCQHLRDDLENRVQKPNGDFDDHGDIGHMTDAWGYVIHKLLPMKLQHEETNDAISIKAR
jgi:hypothetical protein